MEQALRFLIMSASAYLVFLCVIRLVMGSQFKTKPFLINIIGMITVYASFIISRFGNFLKIPDYLYYIIPVLLIVLLPPLSLDMRTNQTLKYLILFAIFIVVLHLGFSFLTGWGDLLPFIKIPSLWKIV